MRAIDRSPQRHSPFFLPGLLLFAAFAFCFLPTWGIDGGAGLEIRSVEETPSPPSDWWAETSQTIADMEYQITATDEGLQGPNRSQSLRTYFREGGIEVGPRQGAPGDWRWSWTTKSWGREGREQSLPSVDPTADAYRVEYVHPSLVEWYENGPAGVEQGFLLPTRPEGDGKLVIEGAWAGDLGARMSDDGAAIDFETDAGARVLRYDGLKVVDARERTLDSSLELDGDRVRLRIDDSAAEYPILVDPILTTPDWTWEPNISDVGFGSSVSTAGDVNGDGYSDLLVGAQRYDVGYPDEGSAFVFYGSADGLGTTPAWSARGSQPLAFFGCAVSTAGDVDGDGYDDIIVGASRFDAGSIDEGRAFLYHGSASGPSSTADWTAESNQANAYFGCDVRWAGDVNGDGYADVVIGADSYTNGEVDEGRAFVYYGSSSGLDLLPDWFAEVNATHAFFGTSVSGAGDVDGDGYDDLVVGAPNYIHDLTVGRFFVYRGTATGLSGTPSWWRDRDEETLFAECVAGAGDVDGDGYADIIVGAPGHDVGSNETGIAYLYKGSASGPSVDPVWEFEGESSYAHLGRSVATGGDVNGDGYADVIVGAVNFTDDQSEEGRAYLFLGHHTGLSTEPDWFTDGDVSFADYGGSVGTAGDVNGDGYSDLVVGAEWYSNGHANEGRASVFHGSPDGPKESAGWVTESNQTGARYGYSMASVGDVNADGFDDVLVGAPYYDNGQVDEGACFLFLGSENGIAALPAWYAESNQAGASFGQCVAGAGDVNGDGLEDLLVAAPTYTNTVSAEGAAFVWHSVIGGGPLGNPANADWHSFSGQAGSRYGFSLDHAGDVNGDGFSDVIIGAYAYDNGQTDEGAAFVYHGSAAGLSTTYDWFHDCDHTNAHYGTSVASAGDFNGDGFSDVIVGAYQYDHPTVGEGAAFVYLGSSDGVLPGAPFWYAESNEANGWMGFSVASAGDVNGDGYSDVVVGAPEMESPAIDGGRAFVWHGAGTDPPNGNPDNAAWSGGRNLSGAWFGAGVSSAGDVNGDGYSDILIGCPFDTSPFSGVDRSGTAFVYLGSDEGLLGPGAYWIGEGSTEWCEYGWRVASAGDVNGDGCSDILVGSPSYSVGSDNEGRSYLYYGNGGRGIARIPRQWESDLSAPIAPLGVSDEETDFAILARVRTPAGRGVVRLVSEVQPRGFSWDGSSAVAEDWISTWAPGSGGSYAVDGRLVSDLYPGFLYKWRVRFESTNPLFPRSPWLHLSGNAPGELDLRMGGTTSSVPDLASASALRLGSSGPNPFRDATSFTWSLPHDGDVRLTVHDVQGRRVRTLVSGEQKAGSRQSSWDGRDEQGRHVAAGVYWFRLFADGEQAVGRVVYVE